jgi:hypothetical protein
MMRGPCRTPPAANYLQRLLVPRMIEAILPRRCQVNARLVDIGGWQRTAQNFLWGL